MLVLPGCASCGAPVPAGPCSHVFSPMCSSLLSPAVLVSDTGLEEVTALHLGFDEDWAAALWERGLPAVPGFLSREHICRAAERSLLVR